MKMQNIFRFIFFLLIIITPYRIIGQETNSDLPVVLKTNAIQEKIVLITDRNFYAVKEKIYFSAIYSTNINTPSFDWSTVLYVELIKPDGSPVKQTKFPLKNKGTSGWIEIPENVLSGIYYLKAYTKWMRNFTTESYAYTPITIINADNAEIDASKTKTSKNTKESSSAEIANFIHTDKLSYGKRENVEVNFEAAKLNIQDFTYCVSVTKPGLKTLSTFNTNENREITAESDTALYLPEIDGISLSGKIKNKNTRKIEENATVNLALLNNQSFLSGFKTNNLGEFYFTFPFSSHEYELFIKAEKDNLDLNIEIHDDFCSKQVELASPNFDLSGENIAILNEMSLNAQITDRFDKIQALEKTIPKVSFYGTPSKVIFTKKYIDLPYLEEFLFELVPEITVLNQDKIPSIHSKARHTFTIFPFLILVDNTPISDVPAFLKIRTNKIERIELIDNGYVSGELKYSGIINAITINNDMAGVELPQNSMFFKFKMFEPQFETENLYAENNKVDKHMPDKRNCLYWNPDFQFSSGSKGNFTFFTSDTKGEYEIIVQSTSKKDGSVKVSRKSFTVK